MSAPQQLFYDIVAREIREQRIVDGVWVRAFSEAGGDEGKARAIYIALRVEQLQEQLEAESAARRAEQERAAKAAAAANAKAAAEAKAAKAKVEAEARAARDLVMLQSHEKVVQMAFVILVVFLILLMAVFAFGVHRGQ
jgi:hypothetical protein